MKQVEIYKKIQDKILSLMETEGTDWTKSWVQASTPINLISKKEYRGINNFWLSVQGYQCGQWATFKQWNEKGYKIKKGEKSTEIIFYQMKQIPLKKLSPTQRETYSISKILPKYFLIRTYRVFNGQQIEDFKYDIAVPNQTKDLSKEQMAYLDDFFANTNAEIKHDSDRAYFSPVMDYINMPHLISFNESSSYYSVLSHEVTHWTGHESRLNRETITERNDENYAKEELVAELGAAFLSNLLGVTKEPRPDHAKYLNVWKARISEDCKVMVQAFSQAQKAVDYIYSFQKVENEEVA